MNTLADILLPYQRDFIFAPQKRKIWVSARQIGKSFAMAWLASCKALQKKNGLSLVISTGARAANEMMRKCVQMAEATKQLSNAAVDFTSSADCVKFTNGSRVLSLPSGNPAALRGYTANCVIVDEANYIEHPEDVIAAIAPTLTRDKDAELVLASTPAGKNSFFYNTWQKAQLDPAWHKQQTSIHDAMKAGLKVDIDALKQLCPDNDIWNMEYEAQFVDEYSSFIDTSLLEFVQDIPESSLGSWVGVDIGSTSDRTAILDVIQLEDQTYVVKDAIMLWKTSYEDQLKTLKELYAKRHWNAGYIDANGIGSAVAEFASKQISTKMKGFIWTGTNKTPAYESLRACIFDHKIKFAEHLRQLVVQDFNNVSRVVTETGQVKYAAGRDQNGHSDFTSALVLALQAAKDSPTSISLPSGWAMPSRFSTSPSFW